MKTSSTKFAALLQCYHCLINREFKEDSKMKKYYERKAHARQIAIDWQSGIASRPGWSWEWVAEWYARFERIGRKYGLLKEFKENGIL